MSSYIDYYVKKFVDNQTKNARYELHGNLWVKDLDVTSWKDTSSYTISGRIGLKTDNSPITDWMLLKFTTQNGQQTWTCEDGYSRKGSSTYTKDTVTESNCMADVKKSEWEIEDEKDDNDQVVKREAEMQMHWMRQFDSGIANHDLKLVVGNYTVDL